MRLIPSWLTQRIRDDTLLRRETPADVDGVPVHESAIHRTGQTLGGRPQSNYQWKRQYPGLRMFEKGLPATAQDLTTTNRYGFKSRSELAFPEAYKPISDEFWNSLPEEERLKQLSAQATAMMKVSFRDKADVPVAMTAADEAYDEASTRRRQAVRRRLGTRPKRYTERKAWDEAKAKEPLQRRYVARTLESFEDSPFAQPGPLDMPVLIQGALRRMKQKPEDTPKRLKVRQLEKPESVYRPAVVPTIETAGAPKVGVNEFNNTFGLRSRAVASYPEAYKQISSVFWRALTREQEQQLMRVKAQAMEKVGFEPRTHKHFIQDFDPAMENLYASSAMEQAETQFSSKFQPVGDAYFNPDDQGISLQNRYGSQEFVIEKKHTGGFALARPVSLALGIGMLGVALFCALAGISGIASTPMFVTAVVCVVGGTFLAIPRV